jgi:hypothetical protein
MHIRTWLLFLVFALGCTTHGALPASEASVPEELSQLERIWNEAHVAGNADVLERLSADDVVVTVSGMQPMTKSEAFAVLRSGRMKFQRYQTSDTRIRMYGDAAVVTGRLQRTRTMGDRIVEDDWQFTKVYTHVSGAWKVVSFHASPAR